MLKAHVVRNLVAELGRHIDIGRKGALSHEASEGELVADVVPAVAAGLADVAVLAGIGGDSVADLDRGHAFADGADGAAELVAQQQGRLCPGEGMRSRRNEDRAGDKLMQVGTADATVGNLDLHPAWLGSGGKGKVLDTDVVLAVPDGTTHSFSHDDLAIG